jgi:hypothetical protein
MAATHEESVQYENVFTDAPVNLNPVSTWGSKLQVMFFNHVQSEAGDATSTVNLVKLPAGRVRLITGLSRAYVNWTTASATLDLGWRAYTGLDGVAVAESLAGIISALDVDTVGYQSLESDVTALLASLGGTKEFTSTSGVIICAHTPTAAIGSGDTIAGYLVYACD